MKIAATCEFLNWDSKFFGRRIARLSENRITETSVEEVFTWCKEHWIDCLYFLADPADVGSTIVAQHNGFYLVDLRFTLRRYIDRRGAGSASPPAIRNWQMSDVPELRAIAKISHRDSRFYSDPQFPNALCDLLYEEWIEKSCHGYADEVLVAELDGVPAGYITCHMNSPGLGRIGLFAVSPRAQGRGIGQNLINAAVDWLADRGAQEVEVVTQGKNIRAQRAYQRCGFFSHAAELWFHRWFSPSSL